MRTTLTLDDDVARLVEEATRRDRRTIEEIVDHALRQSLQARSLQPHRVDVHDSDVRAGTDTVRLNQLPDADDDTASRSA